MRTAPLVRSFQLLAIAGMALTSVPVQADDSPDGDLDQQTIVRSAADLPYTLGAPFLDAQGSTKALTGFVFGGGTVEGDGPNGIAYAPDGSSFVIAHRESQNLVIWDAASLTFLGSVDLPGSPVSVAITPDGSTAVVALVDTGDAAIVDLGSLTVSAVVPIGPTPGAVVIMPAGDLAVVTGAFDSELVVIDLNTNTEARRITDIGYTATLSFSTLFLQRLAYSSPVVVDNDRVMNLDRFRPNSQPDEIQFINVRTGAVNRLNPATQEPTDVDISADGTTAIVAHSNLPTLTRIDLASETITGTIALPENANFSAQIAVNNDATRAAYTISNNTRTINLTTGVAGPLLGTATLNDLITTPDGNRVAGIGFRGTVIDLNAGTNLGNLNQIVSTDFGAMSPDGSRVVQVASTFGESFVVIEPDATPQLIASRLTGPDFEGDRMTGVAVTQDGSTVVGRNRVSNNVVIMDAGTMSVAAQVDAGTRPDGIGISPDGTHAVVANGDSFFATVIDLNTNIPTNVPMGRRGSQVVFSPDNQFAYIPVVADGDGVTRINLSTNTVDGPKLFTGNMGGIGYAFSQASGIAISPDGSTIATAGSFTDNVSFIDAVNWVDLGDTFSGSFPSFVAFSPDSAILVATNRNDDTLSVFDVATRTLTQTIVVGDNPGYPVVSDDNRVFLINFNEDTVGVVDLVAGIQTNVIPFFSLDFPSTALVGLQLDTANDRLYVAYGNASVTLGGDVGVAIAEEGFVDVIDTNSLATLETIDITHGPADLAASSDFNVLAAATPIGDGAVIVSMSLPCPGDIADDFGTVGADGMVSFGDFLALLGLVGPCPGMTPGCAGDIADDFGTLNGSDGMVSFGDFLALLGLVGPCP